MRIAFALGLVGIVGVGIWLVLSGKAEAASFGAVHEIGTAGGFTGSLAPDPIVFSSREGTRTASGIETLAGF